MKKNTGTCAVALGTFDGLHLGHKALLDRLKTEAGDGLSVVYTFSNIPGNYFDLDLKQLFTSKEKEVAISAEGIDVLYMREFNKEVAETTREQFIDELINKLSCSTIIVGYNYRFGRGGKGTAEYLAEETSKRGVRTVILPPVSVNGEPVSSTAIRNRILSGDVESANVLLGRSYSVSGIVTEGSRIGRTLGFPTANIDPPEMKCIPDNGVYAVTVELGSDKYIGMTNIGHRPTINLSEKRVIETYIFDFSGDIYGKEIKLSFDKRIRPEARMSDRNELIAQLNTDLLTIRDYYKDFA